MSCLRGRPGAHPIAKPVVEYDLNPCMRLIEGGERIEALAGSAVAGVRNLRRLPGSGSRTLKHIG